MKTPTLIAITLLSCIGAYIYIGCKPVRQFDNLEQNAKKVLTAAQLQSWATNILAQYPPDTQLKISQLGTNIPRPLLELAPKLGPSIYTCTSYDTNLPSYVRLYWGSGFLGAKWLEIGPTNFVSTRSDNAWAPGVYFVDSSPGHK